MTAFDKYLTETAKNVEATDADAQRSIVTTLEQRIAVSLAEARGIEARHLANEFRLKISHPPPWFIRLADAMDERANKLLKHAMELAREYPPADEIPEPESKGRIILQ